MYASGDNYSDLTVSFGDFANVQQRYDPGANEVIGILNALQCV